MELNIEITTSNVPMTFEKITNSTQKPDLGQEYSIGNDIELTYISGYDDEMMSNETLMLIIGNVTGLGVNLLSSYLYEKLKPDTSTELRINGKKIAIDPVLIEEFVLFLLEKENKTKA